MVSEPRFVRPTREVGCTTAVLIAHESFLIREGLVCVLSAAPGLAVAGAVQRAADLRAALAAGGADVVLIGSAVVDALAGEGIDLYEEVGAYSPGAGIIVLAASEEQALALVSHGASGRGCLFEANIRDGDRLVHAIQEVAAGGSVLEPSVVDLLTEQRHLRARLCQFSPRERQVLELMARGYDNVAIAGTLVLTERTVGKHINSIFRKLDLHARCGRQPRVAAVLAFQALTSRPREAHRLAAVGGGAPRH